MPQYIPKSAQPYIPQSAVPAKTPKNTWSHIGPILKRFAFGPSEEDLDLQPDLTAKRKELGLSGLSGTPESEASIFPHIKSEPESYWGGFGKSLYEDVVRPFGTPSGVLGSASVKRVPTLGPTSWVKGSPTGAPDAISNVRFPGQQQVVDTSRLAQIMEDAKNPALQHGPMNARPGLPPARPIDPNANYPVGNIDPATIPTQPRFFGGRAGVADATRQYPLDTGQDPNLFSGTLGSHEFGERTRIPAMQVAERGVGPIGDIPRPKVNTPSEALQFIEQAKKGPVVIKEPKPPTGYYPKGAKPFVKPELPSAEVKWRPKTATPIETPIAEVSPKGVIPDVETPLRSIADNTSVKDAVLQWTDGRNGAKIRAANVANEFKDLSDPALIAKYEGGDRTGRLGELEKYFDLRYNQAVKMGLLKEDQKRLNYLRHYFEQNPEEVTAAYKAYIAKNPKFAKTGKFQTYAQAQEAGLTPKFKSIPEIAGAYEDEFHKAVRNKEFYDYLQKTKRLSSGAIDTSPADWKFKGDDAKELAGHIKNIFSESPSWFRKGANAFRYTKNLYLGSGIPGTPINRHYYNTAKSAYYGRGIKGIGDYLSGTFNPASDVEYLNSKKSRDLIADLVERGYGAADIEDHNAAINQVRAWGPKALDKIKNFQGKLFEDPLFRVRLPAAKLRMAEEIIAKETPKIGRDAALKLAATISNDFMGGINKVLRHSTTKDAMAIGLLAPDWLETRANLAYKGVKAVFGKEHPMYRNALARKVGLGVAGAAATKAISGQFTNPSNRSSNTTSIPLGQTSAGRNRQLPVFDTTAEEVRLPMEIGAASQNPLESISEKIRDVVSGRMSTPFKAGENLRMNTDAFGNRIYGHDKYGQPMTSMQNAKGIGKELASPFIPPWILMLQELMTGDDPEASINKGLELPMNYNFERRPPR